VDGLSGGYGAIPETVSSKKRTRSFALRSPFRLAGGAPLLVHSDIAFAAAKTNGDSALDAEYRCKPLILLRDSHANKFANPVNRPWRVATTADETGAFRARLKPRVREQEINSA
jgi:hypothetical protein